MKKIVNMLTEKVNVHGELHLDAERTAELLRFLLVVDNTLTMYAKTVNEMKTLFNELNQKAE